MKVTEAVLGNDEQSILGEGPVWDAARERLLWVDIRRGLVYSGVVDPIGTVAIEERFSFDQTVGAVAVADSGDLLIAGAHSLLVRHPDGTVAEGPQIIAPDAGRRLNDGKVDPSGRFVVGTLRLDGDSDSEVLVQIGHDGSLAEIDDDLTLSNGLAWTGAGVLYSVDTMRQTVYSRPYAADGTVGERRIFLTVSEGYPDGMCLDAEEYLWIAMWGLGQVHRYSPSGELVQVVSVPSPHVSSVAFAGPLLETLVITTATQDLTAAQLEEFPYAGHLFTIKPGVRGLASPPWVPFTSADAFKERQ